VSRRRSLLVLLLALVVAAWLTRKTFEAAPGSEEQATLTYVLAAVLLAGAYASGGWPRPHRRGRRPVVGPALTGALLFVAFAVGGWLTSWVGPLDNGVDELLRHARAGDAWQVALGSAAAGLAEEVFYRGAVFERARLPILTATLAHVLTTVPAGNAALTLAAATLGVVLGATRRATGGWWAPAISHVVWALLVVAWLPA
jgi:hypothetical protein